MAVKSLSHVKWEYWIVLELTGGMDDRNQMTSKIRDWGKSNCLGQWMLCDYARMTFHAPNNHKSPITTLKYTDSEISMNVNTSLIAFEREEDLVAFKLTFYEADKK